MTKPPGRPKKPPAERWRRIAVRLPPSEIFRLNTIRSAMADKGSKFALSYGEAVLRLMDAWEKK